MLPFDWIHLWPNSVSINGVGQVMIKIHEDNIKTKKEINFKSEKLKLNEKNITFINKINLNTLIDK